MVALDIRLATACLFCLLAQVKSQQRPQQQPQQQQQQPKTSEPCTYPSSLLLVGSTRFTYKQCGSDGYYVELPCSSSTYFSFKDQNCVNTETEHWGPDDTVFIKPGSPGLGNPNPNPTPTYSNSKQQAYEEKPSWSSQYSTNSGNYKPAKQQQLNDHSYNSNRDTAIQAAQQAQARYNQQYSTYSSNKAAEEQREQREQLQQREQQQLKEQHQLREQQYQREQQQLRVQEFQQQQLREQQQQLQQQQQQQQQQPQQQQQQPAEVIWQINPESNNAISAPSTKSDEVEVTVGHSASPTHKAMAPPNTNYQNYQVQQQYPQYQPPAPFAQYQPPVAQQSYPAAPAQAPYSPPQRQYNQAYSVNENYDKYVPPPQGRLSAEMYKGYLTPPYPNNDIYGNPDSNYWNLPWTKRFQFDHATECTEGGPCQVPDPMVLKYCPFPGDQGKFMQCAPASGNGAGVWYVMRCAPNTFFFRNRCYTSEEMRNDGQQPQYNVQPQQPYRPPPPVQAPYQPPQQAIYAQPGPNFNGPNPAYPGSVPFQLNARPREPVREEQTYQPRTSFSNNAQWNSNQQWPALNHRQAPEQVYPPWAAKQDAQFETYSGSAATSHHLSASPSNAEKERSALSAMQVFGHQQNTGASAVPNPSQIKAPKLQFINGQWYPGSAIAGEQAKVSNPGQPVMIPGSQTQQQQQQSQPGQQQHVPVAYDPKLKKWYYKPVPIIYTADAQSSSKSKQSAAATEKSAAHHSRKRRAVQEEK